MLRFTTISVKTEKTPEACSSAAHRTKPITRFVVVTKREGRGGVSENLKKDQIVPFVV